ncbi:peptidase U32 family protein [Treponema brennaborense]|uniref:Peptidase U32 n=1 Tax=Treponema brennaborense (strain DSM 12168 / CIP 105900 / DD5/3) TaxID=906968 RepID=F4LPJ1_TREBD|nr:peptidase U32 family protein [Treponema brennaborense]AEE16002.1 peptidase U32 [Treponema brennaborense DSM 12168]
MAELLAPAGNIEALDAAIGEGADAVYLGLKSFNARLRSSNFAWNQFEAAVQSVHRLGKKIFVTVNTVSEEWEMERLYRFLGYLDAVGPDGLIVQDFGVVRMVQEFFPKLRLHASTQMNIASARAVNVMSKEGLKRVVLARELGLEEIRTIRANTSAELEVFVHGALCVSESGLCLFSSYLGGKSANRGMCTQACRRFYSAEISGGLEQGYYFSPCDLQLIDKIPDLITAGVDSFKIEGRMKSAEYVGSVTAAYRYVMDHWQEDRKGSVATAKRMLSTDFARTKTRYWYDFNADDTEKVADTVLNPAQAGGTGIYLGKIDRTRSAGVSAADSEGVLQFASLTGGSYDPDVGDSIRLHRKDDTGRVSHKVRSVQDENGVRWIDIPEGFSSGDSVYLLQTKLMSKRYPRVLPHDLSPFRRQPGAQQLPILDLTPVAKNELSYFPEGLYIQVSTVEDLFTVQSGQPVRIILELNSETRADLLEHDVTLPISKKQIFLSLDPFCPASAEDDSAAAVDMLVESGFTCWVVNNPAHIAMLRGKPVSLIAGPYLYTFNRWAVSWLENQEIGAFVMPYENSRRNLEATFDGAQRSRVLIPVFAYPALFRMRFKLPASYDFTFFNDKEGMTFKALSTPDGAFVMPDNPFSIIDKIQFLKNAGFTRYLIDFSKTSVHKKHLKQILTAMYRAQVLPDTSRFNWKDGFYSPEKMEEFRASAERAAASGVKSTFQKKGAVPGKKNTFTPRGGSRRPDKKR